jgi:hypothetical protein
MVWASMPIRARLGWAVIFPSDRLLQKKVAVVKPLVMLVVKLIQGGGFIGLEGCRGPLKHRFRFRRRSGWSGAG